MASSTSWSSGLVAAKSGSLPSIDTSSSCFFPIFSIQLNNFKDNLNVTFNRVHPKSFLTNCPQTFGQTIMYTTLEDHVLDKPESLLGVPAGSHLGLFTTLAVPEPVNKQAYYRVTGP
jgi:hypothetical protein